MTVVDTRVAVRRSERTVDLAGTAWPVYKLEALALGALALVLLLVLTGSPQIAVLAAAAITTVVWWVRFGAERVSARRDTA